MKQCIECADFIDCGERPNADKEACEQFKIDETIKRCGTCTLYGECKEYRRIDTDTIACEYHYKEPNATE